MFRLSARLTAVAAALTAVDEKNHRKFYTQSLEDAIKATKQAMLRYQQRYGLPGISVAVSIDGRVVYRDGVGYSNVETLTPCTGDTVMRIASISKPITACLAMRLFDKGLLDLDKSVYELQYLPDFPKKTWEGKEVTITPRQLLCHTSGIRHYSTRDELEKFKKMSDAEKAVWRLSEWKKSTFGREMLSRKEYKTTKDALEMFKNDELVHKPGSLRIQHEAYQIHTGTDRHYTTHGYTLLAAVLEAAMGEGHSFQDAILQMVHELGMRQTYLDQNAPIIPNRANYYYRGHDKPILRNTASTNNSYKYAGGGLLATCTDLLTFANAMLYAHQYRGVGIAPFVSSEAIKQLWSTAVVYEEKARFGTKYKAVYGLGWDIVHASADHGPTNHPWNGTGRVSHTGAQSRSDKYGFYFPGGAAGASSILMVRPTQTTADNGMPRGICVAIFTNLESVNLTSLALGIIEQFDRVEE